jgi:glycosyltransferase involved in cell wall biosynthesis
VAVWNELTPYRLHFLRRMRSEAPDIRLVNLFTHSVYDNSMPWKLDVPPEIEILHDPAHRATFSSRVNRGSLGLYRFIRDVLRRERPLFAMLAGHNDAARWLTIARARSMGVPIVHHADANIFGEPPPAGPRSWVRNAYLHTVFRRFEGVMPSGTCGRAYYWSKAPRPLPQFVCPLEPDYKLLQHNAPHETKSFCEARGLSSNRRRFLFSGRLVSLKGVDLLLAAFARAAGRLMDWDLVIAGTGPLESQLRSMVPEHLEKRVRFLGFLQEAEMRQCYRSCDVLVHPAQYEPWGLVINEAIASGMAVIATDVTGAAVDLVLNRVNGLLIPAGSEAAIHDALIHISQHDLYRDLKEASAQVLEHWRSAADPVSGFRSAVTHFRTRGAPR